MKTAPFILSALLVTVSLTLQPITARAGMTLDFSSDYVRWAEHQDVADARLAITTEDGKVTLLLTHRVVAVQLSDWMVHKVKRKLRDKKEEQDNALGRAIVTAVAGTVREMIDDSFECRIRDLRDVRYDGGRLQFISRDGRPLFEDADLCDNDDVMSSFSERDARNFVREFRRIKGGN